MSKRKKGSKDELKLHQEKFERFRKEVELEKAANEIKFTNLQEKIQRLEKEIQSLEATKHELSHVIDTKTKENVDLFEQQEYEMRIKDQRIKDSEKERKQLLVENEKLANKHEKDKQQMQAEFEEEKQRMLARIDKLQESIDELHTFKKQKNKILKENAQLKDQLQKTEKYTSETIESAKEKYRNSIREETEKLKQEYEEKMKSLQNQTEKRIGFETTNTMMRNDHLDRELKTQQEEARKIMDANNVLVEKNRELQQKYSIQESQYQELLKRFSKQKKRLLSLSEKLNALTQLFESKGLGHLIKFKAEEGKLLDQQQNDLSKLKKDFAISEDKLKKLEEDKDKLASALNGNHDLRDEITRFLLSTMNDIKLKIGPWKNIDNLYRKGEDTLWKNNTNLIPASLDKLTAKEREGVIRYLISKLHNFDKSVKERYRDFSEDSETMLPPIHSQPSFHERYKEFRKQESRY